MDSSFALAAGLRLRAVFADDWRILCHHIRGVDPWCDQFDPFMAGATSAGWEALKSIDSSKFRISFFTNVVIAVVITLTAFDNGQFVLQRNPLAVAVGAQSRPGYIGRVNPSYAALIQIMDDLPGNAYLYSLFEPRSYSLPRRIQPDAINYNFAHDLYLYKRPSEIIQHWKTAGYTHLLLYERGLDFVAQDPASEFTSAARESLSKTLRGLELVTQTPDRVYSIYRIP